MTDDELKRLIAEIFKRHRPNAPGGDGDADRISWNDVFSEIFQALKDAYAAGYMANADQESEILKAVIEFRDEWRNLRERFSEAICICTIEQGQLMDHPQCEAEHHGTRQL